MIKAMITIRLTRLDRRRLTRAAARFIAPCLLACLLCGAAAAYTVVMRGGRRVDIPGEFELTRTMLTYEAAPGVSVALPLDHIDVGATERANDEPAGSFLRRAGAAAGRGEKRLIVTPAVRPRAPLRTVTNRDLEAVRRARVESERDYERRRVELGLPSAEEMRQHNEREEASMRELARQKMEADAAAVRDRHARDDEAQREIILRNDEDYYALRRSAELSTDTSGFFSSDVLTIVTTGRPNYHRRFHPSSRSSPFATARHPDFDTSGARHRPRLRRGVSAGFDVNGGTRAGVSLTRRGLRIRPAGRR